jgi:hypothetical protein
MRRRPLKGGGYPIHLITPQEKTSLPNKDITKQPLQEPTRAPFPPLSWRAWGIVRGSLEDAKIGPNIVEASNRPQQTDVLKSGPTGHENPFVDIEINSL